MIAIGQTVGNYRVKAKLGEGGMGEVFLAEHPVIGRKVALKTIHPQLARNAEVVARFVTEARSVNRIGHENIVDVTDFGHTPAGDFYLIMEYLQGDMLSERIGRVPFPPTRAIAIAAQIADALEASHQQGVVHRDLKPDNVLLLTRNGTTDFVKVFDFGLAKLTHEMARSPAQGAETEVVMGTPLYMSPEQCDPRCEVDHRADVYSLGVILFQMLAGRVPFHGEGFGEILAQHLTRPAPLVRSLVPEVPEALEAAVGRALAKDPNDRFQSMSAFRAALLDCALAPTAGQTIEVARVEPRRPKHRRGRTLPLALAAFAFVAVGNLDLRRQVIGVLGAASMPPRAPRVSVDFSSDPAGAIVSERDGTKVGVTPFSTEIPYGEVSVEYLVRKEGYVPKLSALIPNLPQPVFVVLQKVPGAPPAKQPVPDETRARRADDTKPSLQAQARSHRARLKMPLYVPALDGDDVMAPTTW